MPDCMSAVCCNVGHVLENSLFFLGNVPVLYALDLLRSLFHHLFYHLFALLFSSIPVMEEVGEKEDQLLEQCIYIVSDSLPI